MVDERAVIGRNRLPPQLCPLSEWCVMRAFKSQSTILGLARGRQERYKSALSYTAFCFAIHRDDSIRAPQLLEGFFRVIYWSPI